MIQKLSYLPFIDKGFFFFLRCQDLHLLGLNIEACSRVCMHELNWGPFGCRIDVSHVSKKRAPLLLCWVFCSSGLWSIVYWNSWGPSGNLRLNKGHMPCCPVLSFAQNNVAWIAIGLRRFIRALCGGLCHFFKLCLLLLHLDLLVRNHGVDRLFFKVFKWINLRLLSHL